MSSEFARIALLEASLKQASNEVALGIGDDCAVLNPSAYPRVWTVDAMVEGVHFTRALMTLEQAAYRAFMAAASDLAAMGAAPVAALSALTLPSAFSDDELRLLASGLARAAQLCACPIVGGNLARAEELTLTTSVLGECRGPVITRQGARPGDGVFVTGPVGGSALGLRALQAGYSDARFEAAISCFRAPRARLDLAAQVAAIASAAIDISDGLAQDLDHVCRASGVGIELDAASIPRLPGFAAAAQVLGVDPLALALSGGEDYELAFTAPAAPRELATRIGTVVAGTRVCARDAQGRELVLAPGFDHFATR